MATASKIAYKAIWQMPIEVNNILQF